jgi:hypothetical protein
MWQIGCKSCSLTSLLSSFTSSINLHYQKCPPSVSHRSIKVLWECIEGVWMDDTTYGTDTSRKDGGQIKEYWPTLEHRWKLQ